MATLSVFRPLDREILKLSVPAIVSNVTVPLLGLCDTAISGHLGSERFLGAIAVGSMMLNVVFWLFGCLRMGTTGLTAAAFGASDNRALSDVFRRSLILALAIGLALILFQRPLMSLLLALIAPSEDVRALAESYFSICVWESPALLSIMALSGWMVGMQSTLWPMIVAVTVNVINIVLSFLLVFTFKIGFTGVAIGTLCANWIGFAVALFVVFRMASKRGISLLNGDWRVWKGGGLGKFFSVNSDLFFRSACIMAVTLSVTAFGARQGSLVLASNAVMLQFFHFFSFFMDGFAFTGEALCGRFSGAGDPLMLRRSVNRLLLWSAGVAILFFTVYAIGWSPVVGLLTDDEPVRHYIAGHHGWLLAIPPVTVAAFIYDGFYIGVSRTRLMLFATVIASLLFFAVSSLSLDGGPHIANPGNDRLWTAFLLYLFARGAILALLWHRRSNVEF